MNREIKFSLVYASDNMNGISKDNKLPWKISEDLKHFNNITSNFSFDDDIVKNVIIMGANTAKEIEKPLPNRYNIVLRSKGCYGGGFIIETDFDQALERAKKLTYPGKKIFVVGGAKNINHSMTHPNLDKIYYTYINKNFNCDNFTDSILNRSDMVYDILKKEKCIDKNTGEEVELIFYLIIPKSRFETDYKQNEFTLEVNGETFDSIKLGDKTYEVLGNTMKNQPINSKIKRNDLIEFKNGENRIRTKVLDVQRYLTFEEALKYVDVNKIYPKEKFTKEQAIQHYDKIYSIVKQNSQSGIFVIKFEVDY
jgi:dihydrofolate reductase/ASC-1-like (ASCH) protein